MSKEEMKTCPFCGSNNVGIVTALGTNWGKCGDCFASGPAIDEPDTTERAVEAWNRRTE